MDAEENPISINTFTLSREKLEGEDDVLFYQFLHNNPGAWELYNMVLQRKEADNKIRLRSTKTLVDSSGTDSVPPTPRDNIITTADSVQLSARKSSGTLFKRESRTDLTQSMTPRSARKSWFKTGEKVSTESAPADLPSLMTPIEGTSRLLTESETRTSVTSRFSTHEGNGPVKRKSRRSVDKKKKKGERIEEDMGPPPPNFIPAPPPQEVCVELPPKKSHTDSYSLFVSLVNLSTGIDVCSKNWHMKTYRQVFMANKVVEWIVENMNVSRPKATQLGYELQTSGFIEGVVKGTIFKDERLMFQLTEKGKTILREQDFMYFTKAFDSVNGIEIKDRSGHFKKLKGCFTGEEFVTWFVENGLAPSRERACRLGREFLESHLIEHVLKEQHFKDATLFYHLTKEGLLLLKNQTNTPSNNLSKATSTTQIKRKQSEKILTKKLDHDPQSSTVSLDTVAPRLHSISEPRRMTSMEISQSSLSISKESSTRRSKKEKREKKASNKSDNELLHTSSTKTKSRTNSTSRQPETLPEEPSTVSQQFEEDKKKEDETTKPDQEKKKDDISKVPQKSSATSFNILKAGHFKRKSDSTDPNTLTRNEEKATKDTEHETVKVSKTFSSIRRKTYKNQDFPTESTVHITLPEPDSSKLLTVPHKPKPPHRRLPKRFTRSSKDVTTTKDTFSTPSRVSEKRLTRKRSYENPDKENIHTDEGHSTDPCAGESPKKTLSFKLPLTTSTHYNIPTTTQDTVKPSVLSNLDENQLPEDNPEEEQSFSIIIRRFNRRGGVRIIVPDTMEELFTLASAKLKVSGVRLREMETEAEITDIRLFKPDQCVWLTTTEDEQEFM